MSAEISHHVMDETAARRLTERIRIAAHTYAEAREKLIGYVEEARAGSAHTALGYPSWTAYLADVLGDEPMRLARDERREVVQLLSGEGMSTRAIAPIVGTSFKTIARDAQAPVSDDTPGSVPSGDAADGPDESDESDEPEIDLAYVDKTTGEIHDEPVRVTGLDGKSYTRPEPMRQSKPRRRPLTDAFRDKTFELGQRVTSLMNLIESDRFPQNAERVATANRSDLVRAIDALQRIVDRLPEA